MNLPIEVILTRPVVIGDTTYETLTFDEPDLAAQIAYAELEDTLPEPKREEQPDGSFLSVTSFATEMKVTRFWIAALSGVSEGVAGSIKESDLDVVNSAVSRILSKSSADGGGSSGNVSPVK